MAFKRKTTVNTGIGNMDPADAGMASSALDDRALEDVNGGGWDNVFRLAADLAKHVVPPLANKVFETPRD